MTLSHLPLLFLSFDLLRCLQAVQAPLPIEKVYGETWIETGTRESYVLTADIWNQYEKVISLLEMCIVIISMYNFH